MDDMSPGRLTRTSWDMSTCLKLVKLVTLEMINSNNSLQITTTIICILNFLLHLPLCVGPVEVLRGEEEGEHLNIKVISHLIRGEKQALS